MALKQQFVRTNGSTPIVEAKNHKGSCQPNLTGGAISSLLTKHAQLLKRFRLDLSLAESDFESSFCVSLSSATSTPSKSQDTPKDTSTCGMEDDTGYSSLSLEKDCNIPADLVSLFFLMSILPEPAASKCKQALDRDQLAWKIHLYDVILVLLNWGATLQSLGIENILNMPSSLFNPQIQPAYSSETRKKINFPLSSNITLVLSCIRERLPAAESPSMPSSHRALLVNVLVQSALDIGHRCYLSQYCRTIRTVLDSCHPWGPNEASNIVNTLRLGPLGPQNAVFVCCSLFNMTFSRLNLVGLLATHKVLHQLFGLPAEHLFAELIQHLLHPPELLNKYKLWHIYIITSLLHSLLVRNSCQSPPCSQEAISGLYQWTVEVRSALTQYPYLYSLASSNVRERLSRLTAECATLMRTLYKTSISKTYSQSMSMD